MPILHEPFCIGIRGDGSSAGGRRTEMTDDGNGFYEDHKSSNVT